MITKPLVVVYYIDALFCVMYILALRKNKHEIAIVVVLLHWIISEFGRLSESS